MRTESLTRRRLLASTTVLCAGLAGCKGSSHSKNASSGSTLANHRTDPPAVIVRNTTDQLVVSWDRNDSTDDGNGMHGGSSMVFVTSKSDIDDLSFEPVDGVEKAKQFMQDTDFDSETIYYVQRPVPDCYKLQVCSVSWSETEVDTEFSRVLRPVDVSCIAGMRIGTAVFIRIPGELNPDSITSFSSGSGPGQCDSRSHSRTGASRSSETASGRSLQSQTTQPSPTQVNRS